MQPDNKFVNVLLTLFRAGYGGAFSDGLISSKMHSIIVQGLAFGVLSDQDESTDLRRVQAKIGEAVAVVIEQLNRGDMGRASAARAKPVFKQ